MKTWKMLPLLIATLGAVACQHMVDEGSSGSSGAAISRKTLDGAYMKVYGGKESWFVFHTGDKGNTFFAEFEGPDRTILRAEGTFTYGHDKLGNFIQLKRASLADSPPSDDSGSPVDATPPDPGIDAAPDPAPDSGDLGLDAGHSDADAADLSDAAPPPPLADDAGSTASDAGPAPAGDPTAAVYDRFHFVKTGAHDTILTRDTHDRIYQFKQVSSYCGARGVKDCAYQHAGKTCSTRWTCTAQHTCACAAK